MRAAALQVGFLIISSILLSQSVGAVEPLHQRIDAHIDAASDNWMIAPRSDDAEFVRRIYVDLAGRIPTIEEVRSFLHDSTTDKRGRLIDRLLADSDFPQHMTNQLHIMLMERLGNDPEWEKFLLTSFRENRPWDEMVREMLHANRENEDTRGAAYFLTSRLISEGAMAETDVPGLTRDVSRLLAGQDLQCAQCHDHVSIDDYKQRDFQGLHTIFLNVKQDRTATFPAITEGLMSKKHEFMSVFIQQQEETGPVVPGAGEIEIPVFQEGEEYKVPPDRKKKIDGVPAFSPLETLARELAQQDNAIFRRNAANRFWFLMLGRGLVHPLDVHHSGNPPSHPELLEELGQEFAAHNFDIKWLLKEIALSETYQRTSRLPDGQEPPPREKFLLAHQKRISPEQLFESTLVATGERRTSQAVRDEASKAEDEKTDAFRQQFVKLFANPPREPETEFEPSVQGTLFVLNNAQVQRLFERRKGNLIDRLASLPNENVADELFLSVLSRPPSPDDRADVDAVLAQATDRDSAISQLAWALWSSNEFFLNH
ncbi:MAG: DUF1553 domain-containing protein [Planctomycetaceae bacterium]